MESSRITNDSKNMKDKFKKFSSCDLFIAILLVMLLIVAYIFPKRETAFLLSSG